MKESWWAGAAGVGAHTTRPALPVLSSPGCASSHPLHPQLATLRSMARSMRHQHSSVMVSDRAGERLTEDLMEEGGGGGGRGLAGAASASASASALGSDNGGGSSSRHGGGSGGGSARATLAAAPVPQPPPQRQPSHAV